MATIVKDLDGARAVNISVQDGSFFVWGKDFSYEFDLGIWMNALRREVGWRALCASARRGPEKLECITIAAETQPGHYAITA